MRRILLIFMALLATSAAADMRIPANQAEIQIGFTPLVKSTAPAVVNIYARRIVATRQTPFQNDPFFRDLFQNFGQTRPEVQNSLGSGVILSPDGIIVSNYHVVGGATDIRVALADRREYDARVLLADEESDLAILKLEGAKDLPFLTLRDSDRVEVGELVLAIGNPFGLGQTVTSGIISGLARSGAATGQARGYFLQTDAAINPGNSGGALIDINGALIGVNTSILTRSGGSLGIGFAIPANLVRQFMAQAAAGNTTFERPWAGMNGQPVDAEIAVALKLDRPGGIVISDLHDVSPFKEAGLLSGDVILAVDGQSVNTPAEMIFRMSVVGIGSMAKVSYLRNEQPAEIMVEMRAAPDLPPRDKIIMGRDSMLPDLAMVNINPAVLAEFSLPLGAFGVVVETPGPFGARVGLAPGDLIQKINDTSITTTKDALNLLKTPTRTVAIEVQRGLQRILLRFRP